MMGYISDNHYGVNVEHNDIHKLKPLQRNKRLKNVNMIVVRFSKNKKLQNSKPCADCIKKIKILPCKKGIE